MVQSLTSGAVTLAGIAGKIMRLRANESRATLESTNLRGNMGFHVPKMTGARYDRARRIGEQG